jgi:hypothetical protein
MGINTKNLPANFIDPGYPGIGKSGMILIYKIHKSDCEYLKAAT